VTAVAGTRKKGDKWPENLKQKALAVYETTGSMSAAARSVGCTLGTFKRWLKAPVTEKVKEAKEEAKVKFVREAWDTILKGIDVGNTVMSFALENKGRIDEAIKMVLTSPDIDKVYKADLVHALLSLTKFSMRELAIYIGTIYDKIALATGKPTGINRLEGQVTDTHEYKVTQEIIASHPELLDVIFPPDQRPGVAGAGGPGTRPGLGELR
jgi:transposase-like protein